MVLCATRFTPEVLLSAPRRGPAVPNHDGSIAFYEVSTYSFEKKKTTKEIRILDIKTGASTLFTNDENAHDVNWLGDGTNAIIWLQSGADGITSLMVGDGDEPSKASYTADVILAPFQDLKLKSLDDGSIACAMSGLATPEGSLYNKETAEKPLSSARTYEDGFVRYWNRYEIQQKNTIWYSRLAKEDDKYSLAAPVHNALKGTGYSCPFDNGITPTLDEFDISSTGIAFKSFDPHTFTALNHPSKAYFIPLKTFTESEAPKPKQIFTGNYTGETSGLRFSPCGKKIAFLAARDDCDVPDMRLMLVPNCLRSLHAVDLLEYAQGDPWPLIPAGVEWAHDGKGLYLTADDCGRVVLFHLPLTDDKSLRPTPVTEGGAVVGYYPLGGADRLLVSSTNYVDNSFYTVVDCSDPFNNKTIISSLSHGGLKLGLSSGQISEMYFEGGGDYCVHAFVVKPSFFDDRKTYPLALLMHGGPADAWREAWSTRWNPAVFAEQGYIVVLPNYTGSTGFGLDFIKGIRGQWGGRPYQDLVKCFDYVKENMPFVDTENAVALGASYGGYMANWVQGNALGRKFKAIVCHDGIINTQGFLAGDDYYDKSHFNGSMLPWENFENLNKWNPARPDLLKNWKTPMLVIHSDLDYRCPITDGWSAFATLQAHGTPSKYLNFPDEGHWVLKPENSLVWHHTVIDWINKYSGISKAQEESRLRHSPKGPLPLTPAPSSDTPAPAINLICRKPSRELGGAIDDVPPPGPPQPVDYQMQLMLLEQQNKKRLMMTRQRCEDYQMQLLLIEQQNQEKVKMARQRCEDYQMQLLLIEQQNQEKVKMAQVTAGLSKEADAHTEKSMIESEPPARPAGPGLQH
ncbi:MAG: hypothetical protein M1818_007601 [Claussenomyces sp. TS43310]|nr:MAG: hypothetical protein M1818_007601 [Claussenomyces sp. TS43310]